MKAFPFVLYAPLLLRWKLLEGSKVEMVEKIGYALIDTNSAIDDGCVLCIDKQDRIDDDDRN